MNRLPHWNIPVHSPAIIDAESLTVLEQTARLYDTMNQLIDEFNKLVDQVNEFEDTEQANREEYENSLTKVIREFICSWEQKTQDIEGFVRNVINESIQSGAITVSETYDPETESLNMSVTGGV